MVKDILDKNNSVTPSSNELEILREHFPACFKEDGSFDIVRFQEYLKDKVDVTDEGYELRFLGKNYARMLASLDTTTVIVPDEAHNSLPENKNSKNIYISGDNLDALKHLLKSYAGQIKCIYIDPPYNTGSDGFVYNDNFNFTAEELSTKLSVSTEKAQRILDLTRRGSASHSAWLMFMLPRLLLARDLLSKDGVIFISIDDNEQGNLKLLCDDIFGEDSFISQFIWEKRVNRENRAEVSIRHDYILCYSRGYVVKDKRVNQLPMTDKALANYSNPDDDPNGLWKSDPAHAQAGHGTESQFYVLTAPNGKKHELPSGRCWVYTEEVMNKEIEAGHIWFGKDGNGVPRIKTYLFAKDRGLTPESILFADSNSTNEQAKNDLKDLFDGISVFETPKPISLINTLVLLSTEPNDIVMDFFSGSGATAHAVMESNANITGNRKCICVQIPEITKPDSEAYRAGYKTIDEIGLERIKRAAKKIKNENPLFHGDLGFRHFTLMEPSGVALEKIIKFDKNTAFGDNTLMDEFGVPTILTTWLEKDGYGLTSDYQVLRFGGYEAYFIDKHLYLINPDLSDDAVAMLLDKYQTEVSFNPQNVVIYGYSFGWNELQSLKDSLQTVQAGEKNLRINFEIRY